MTIWTVSVRELAEFVWRKGDIGSPLGQAPGPTLQQGSAGHRRLQGSRQGHYQAEVFLKRTVEAKGIELEVAGRADGVFLDATPIVLEEIKTTNQPLIFIDGEGNPLHWAQAKLYGALYLEQSLQDLLDIQLTYFHVMSGEVRSFKKRFERNELRSFFKETVAHYGDWIGRISKWHSQRDGALARLVFPYPSYREGQVELATEVGRALESATPLFVQAPTGSGKTMAILYGALQTFVREGLDQIVYLTAKTVGRLSAERAVEHLRRGGTELKSLSLVSREAICPYPSAGCKVGECPVAEGHYDRLPEARISLYERVTTGRNDVLDVARTSQVCPHSLQMELVKWVDIVIGDYNYVFDPIARIGSLTTGSSVSRALLVDEAHNLVERARQMYSFAVESKRFAELSGKLGSPHKHVKKLCMEIVKALQTMWEEKASVSNDGPVLDGLPEKFLRLLERFYDALEGTLESISQPEIVEECRARYFEVAAFLRAVKAPGSSDVLYVERMGRYFVLKSFCVDPSNHLSEIMKRNRARPIFFSGTLTPLDYFERTLAGGDQKRTRIMPSPFPEENCRPIFLRGISTRYPHRIGSRKPIAETIRTVALAHRGNYMAFFPSYDYLTGVARLLSAQTFDVELISQRPGMTETQKEEFLAHFRVNRSKSLVGFAVLGGLFGEGIDLVGDRLQGAILVSPGLPKICLERELVREYFDREEQRGFEFAYLFPGMNKVLQAAGRVIRTDRDRGIVVFVGDRFLEEAYRGLLPDRWRSGEVARDFSSLRKSLGKFWSPRDHD